METSLLKNWLCPNFLLLTKKSELPKIWGGRIPPGSPRNLLPCAKRKDLCTNLAEVTKQSFGKNTNESVNNSVKTHCKTARWAYIERLASDLKKKMKTQTLLEFC